MRSVIVLPTYNERENIGPFLRAVRCMSPELEGGIDVLVVDDSSPDGTAAAALELGEELGSVEVLVRPGKQGLGSAYRAGFRRVLDEGYDVIVSMDADLSHDPSVIPSMLAAVEAGADVVLGSRYVTGGSTEHWPLHRRVLSRWGNTYTRFVLRLPIRDCTSGFRAYRAAALEAIGPDDTAAEGYAFLTELVRRSARRGLQITEVPITFRDRTRGASKMSARIIAESMFLVTAWAITDPFRRRVTGRPVRH